MTIERESKDQHRVLDDPGGHLNDACMIHIFSFIGGNSSLMACNSDDSNSNTSDDSTSEKMLMSMLGVVEAGMFYYKLSRVSRSWKEIMNDSIVKLVGPLKFDFYKNNDKKMEGAIKWLCHHQFQIGALLVAQPHFHRYTSLLGQLLCECDTTNLTFARIRVQKKFGFPLSFSKDENQLVWEHVKFQEELARKCPNLRCLHITLGLNGSETLSDLQSEQLSPNLFDLSSISKLSICFVACGHRGLVVPIRNSNIMVPIIGRLPNLRTLSMTSSSSQYLFPASPRATLRIVSSSLQHLHVQRLANRTSVMLSLDCPNLKTFHCCGLRSSLDANAWNVRQNVIAAENVPDDCVAHVLSVDDDGVQMPTKLPFSAMIQDTVQLVRVTAPDLLRAWMEDLDQEPNN